MLKNLKSLFIKDEGKSEQKGDEKNELSENPSAEIKDQLKEEIVANPTKEVEYKETVAPQAEEGNTEQVDTTGEISDKFMDILLGAMKKSNREGFDYMEYKQSLQSLKKMEMDDATRFQSAFAMAQTMGASKENITSSASYYLDVLKQEKQKFQAVVANQNQKQVVSKKEGADDIIKAIQNKEAQINKLKEDIDTLKKQHNLAQKEIQVSKTKVEKTKNDFLVTYDLLESQIQKDVQLIKKYLQ